MESSKELLEYYIQNGNPSYLNRIVGKIALDLSYTQTNQTDQNSAQIAEESTHPFKVLCEKELRNLKDIKFYIPRRICHIPTII